MTAKVIRGPWKKTDQTEKELEKAQLLADCDQISSDCMVAVLIKSFFLKISSS